MENIYDLIIIGLGPAGMRAAEIALSNNLKVLAFEKETIGGCCLNRGCVPTKAILHSAEIFEEMKKASITGIKTEGEIKPEISSIIKRKNDIVQKLAKAAENAFIKKGLEIIKENASVDYINLSVNGKKAKNIIISTGSEPYELSNLKFNKKDILSSDDILNLENLPKSIAIIGSGAIGIEWARIFSSFDVNVTLIEKENSILPNFDIDIQKRILRILKMKKVKVLTGVCAQSYENKILTLDNNEKIETDIVLVAVGRKRIIPGNLTVNPDLTTNYDNIYAIGDIAAKKMLAHTASMHANCIMNKIAGKEYQITKDNLIPSVIYGSPEAASIGLIEQETDESYKIHNLPVSYLSKSWCDNKTDGFIKIITKDNLIKGAHIISPEASSLICTIQIMMNTNYSINKIKETVFAHPTYSEGIYEALKNG